MNTCHCRGKGGSWEILLAPEEGRAGGVRVVFFIPPIPVQEQGFNREMEGVLGFGALFWGDRELPSVASGCRVCVWGCASCV